MALTIQATQRLSDQMQVMAERTVARIMTFRFTAGNGTLPVYAAHYNVGYFLWNNDEIRTNILWP